MSLSLNVATFSFAPITVLPQSRAHPCDPREPLARGLPRARLLEQRLQEAVAETPPPPPLPLIKTMKVGDGTLAGDANFDPLQIADSPEKLAWYREAEVKHARLAMLAAFGWCAAQP